jgi:quercetin dioxygenase-like cupin family protein
MRTSDRSRTRKPSKPSTKTEFKRHQVTLDDDRWEWLEGLPGGASQGLRALIDLARDKGLMPGEDSDDQALAAEDAPIETVLEAVPDTGHVLHDVVASLAADSVELVAELTTAEPAPVSLLANLDVAAYVPGGDFHVPGASIYRGTLGTAVNKKAADMAKVVYEPAHLNTSAEGMWRGAGRDFATWIFTEEQGLNERLLESGLELLMDVTLEPGASVGYHVHRGTEEIYYLLAGSLTVATVATDGRVHTETLQTGDAHLVRRGQGHSCEAGAEGCRFITVAGRL